MTLLIVCHLTFAAVTEIETVSVQREVETETVIEWGTEIIVTGDDHAAVTVRGGGPAAETGIIEVHIQKTEIGERKTEIGEN